jgi:hypothetical protein
VSQLVPSQRWTAAPEQRSEPDEHPEGGGRHALAEQPSLHDSPASQPEPSPAQTSRPVPAALQRRASGVQTVCAHEARPGPVATQPPAPHCCTTENPLPSEVHCSSALPSQRRAPGEHALGKHAPFAQPVAHGTCWSGPEPSALQRTAVLPLQ